MNLLKLTVLFIGASITPAGDLYVDQAAVNCAAGTGTAADPVCTIPEAIALATAGDTVHIAPGTYFGPVAIPFDLELVGTGGQVVTVLDAEGSGSVVSIPAGVTGTLDGLTLRNGRAIVRGGGIVVEGNLNLRNSTVMENGAFGIFGFVGGGGIAALSGGSTVVIEQCSISNNDTEGVGGGVAVSGGVLTIRNSTISSNGNIQAFNRGGGVFSVLSLVQITNTTISGNFAYAGGALYAGYSLLGSGLFSSTVTNNTGFSGSVLVGGPGTFGLRNNVLAGNSLSSVYNNSHDVSGTFGPTSHNLIGAADPNSGLVNGANGDLVGTVMSPIEPQLDILNDNGGPTRTHALFAGSPAIDAGDPLQFQPFDQRGVARPVGAAPDMGAIEGEIPQPNLCNGDGGDQLGCTNCPCGNNALPGTQGGCLNRLGTSARLIRHGINSVSLPPGSTNDLRFSLELAPPTTLCVLTSGDSLAPLGMTNPCFGSESGVQAFAYDGLRCAVANTRRHGSRSTDALGRVGLSTSPWGGEGPPSVGLALAFGGFAAGDTRYFQVVYREDAMAGCMRGLNTSQALMITFSP